MCQEWIDVDPEVELVDLIRPDEDIAGRKPVVYAEDGLGQPVVLVHGDDPQLRSIAVFDVIINNADRKGGHILVDAEGRVRGCDHGVVLPRRPEAAHDPVGLGRGAAARRGRRRRCSGSARY